MKGSFYLQMSDRKMNINQSKTEFNTTMAQFWHAWKSAYLYHSGKTSIICVYIYRPRALWCGQILTATGSYDLHILWYNKIWQFYKACIQNLKYWLPSVWDSYMDFLRNCRRICIWSRTGSLHGWSIVDMSQHTNLLSFCSNKHFCSYKHFCRNKDKNSKRRGSSSFRAPRMIAHPVSHGC